MYPTRWMMDRMFVCLSMAGAMLTSVAADDTSRGPVARNTAPELLLNAEVPTLGGKQFWTDEFVHLGWRIQRNVLGGHHRLLDDKNVRRAWGDFDQCRGEFERLKRELKLPVSRPRVVLVLHGLVRSRESMDSLCAYLNADGEFSALNVSYASSREKVADHAAALARVVERLEGVDEVNFVAHSLGNLVIRHYLGDLAGGADVCRTRPRIGRIVMIAPPNNGAALAHRFRDNPLFRTLWGETGRELAEEWHGLEPRLAVPNCQFGVIAGGKGDMRGLNPLLPGDDDFVVTVDETRLPGARDFVVLPALHGTIMGRPDVQQLVLRFLREGYFISTETRQPIPSGLPVEVP